MTVSLYYCIGLNEAGWGRIKCTKITPGIYCTLVMCDEMVVSVHADSAVSSNQQPTDIYLINNHQSVLPEDMSRTKSYS